jgi:NADH-quinone oxidoreductase subunit E
VDTAQKIQQLIELYPTRLSALMPSIWAVQDEHGWVSPQSVDLLVETLGVPRAKVEELLTFYTMFRTAPPATYPLQVCHNISCNIMGARNLIGHLEQRLGVKMGETTPDGRFALEGVECLGACGHAPVMQLGKHFYEHLTPEKVDGILESLRRDVVPRADTDRELEA